MIISVTSAKLLTPWFWRVSPLCVSVMHTLSFFYLEIGCVWMMFFRGVEVLQQIQLPE